MNALQRRTELCEMGHHHLTETIVRQDLPGRDDRRQRVLRQSYLFVGAEDAFLEEVLYPLDDTIATGAAHVGEHDFADQQSRLGLVDFHCLKEGVQRQWIAHVHANQ